MFSFPRKSPVYAFSRGSESAARTHTISSPIYSANVGYSRISLWLEFRLIPINHYSGRALSNEGLDLSDLIGGVLLVHRMSIALALPARSPDLARQLKKCVAIGQDPATVSRS
jgi:hypothetical protein